LNLPKENLAASMDTEDPFPHVSRSPCPNLPALLIAYIGAGSFGKIYKARLPESGAIVAVKVFSELDISGKAEADIMSLVDHPNVVRSLGLVNGALLMEWGEVSLSRLVGRISVRPEICLSLCRQLLRGVSAIHRACIVHADIKESNILITRDHVLKIADFGSAFLIGSEPRGYVGSPGYSAPELLASPPAYSPAVDMWSLGCVIYQLLTESVLFAPSLTRITLWKGRWRPQNSEEFREFLLKTLPVHYHCLTGLLEGLLQFDPKRRFTAEQALAWPEIANAPEDIKDFIVPEAGFERIKTRECGEDARLAQELRPKRVPPRAEWA
jgi:serine/threonine protein kinase